VDWNRHLCVALRCPFSPCCPQCTCVLHLSRAREACPRGRRHLYLSTWPTLNSFLFLRGTSRTWAAGHLSNGCWAVRLQVWHPWLVLKTFLIFWAAVTWGASFITLIVPNQFRYLSLGQHLPTLRGRTHFYKTCSYHEILRRKSSGALLLNKHNTPRVEVINWVAFIALFLTSQMLSVRLLILWTFFPLINPVVLSFMCEGNVLLKTWIIVRRKQINLWNYFHFVGNETGFCSASCEGPEICLVSKIYDRILGHSVFHHFIWNLATPIVCPFLSLRHAQS
jgi:hypothetical protein